MKEQNQTASYYLRYVWQWASDAQDHIDKAYDGHYVEKCEIKKLLQGFKNAIREDLKTLGTSNKDI